MPREIKFRGMDIRGKWHYGNLAIITERIGVAMAGSYISNSVGSPFAYFVRPETVGQFTGLKDKNGKEIYEGDIAKQIWDPFKEGREPKIAEIIIEPTRGVCVGGAPIWIHDCEIIGNIYENPELLN